MAVSPAAPAILLPSCEHFECASKSTKWCSRARHPQNCCVFKHIQKIGRLPSKLVFGVIRQETVLQNCENRVLETSSILRTDLIIRIKNGQNPVFARIFDAKCCSRAEHPHHFDECSSKIALSREASSKIVSSSHKSRFRLRHPHSRPTSGRNGHAPKSVKIAFFFARDILKINFDDLSYISYPKICRLLLN